MKMTVRSLSLSFCFLALLFSAVVFSQEGTLKIFSEIQGSTVFVDENQQTNVQNITLSAGTHYVRVMNGDTKVYGEIVTIQADQTTTVLIKSDYPSITAKTPENISTPVQTTDKPAVVTFNPNATYEPAPTVQPLPVEVPPAKPVINIGQVNGKLPVDKSGAFGLSFGMSESTVSGIMQPQLSSTVGKGKGYISYALADQTVNPPVPFLVECRFIEDKLFQIIVGYIPIDVDPNTNKMSMNKNVIPMAAYTKIYAELTAQYGNPTSSERTFIGNYKDGDGNELEAIKKKQALILSTWNNADTGNEVYLTIAYSTMPMVGVAYQDGALSKQAQEKKLVIHSYKYQYTYRENFFSK